MSKRKRNDFEEVNYKIKAPSNKFGGKKHTLDSDEEDYVDEDNVLPADDIEGEEDGVNRQDDGQKMTAFNMKEEMEEGHFDKQGHFIWNNEKEIKDNWLDNIDWHRIKNDENNENKYNIDDSVESDSESEPDNDFNEINNYKQIIAFMKPSESINKCIKRLSGNNMKLSSLERLKRKKAGLLDTNEDVTKITELANQILTNLGNMDIYQETFEQIESKIKSHEGKGKSKEAELDMYADDFEVKEQAKMQAGSSTAVETNDEKPKGLMWEFKWKADDEAIQGPFTTQQMIQWSNENYFTPGVMVRKSGENFYSLQRIDFDLYE